MSEATGSTLGRFVQGLRAPAEGFAYMLRHPKLWRYAIFPILLNILLTCLVLLTLVGAVLWFISDRRQAAHPGAWGVIKEIAIGIAAFASAGLLAMATWMLLNGILGGYFYSKLAREVELQLGTPPEDLREVPFRHQVVDALRDTASLVGINLLLLLLNVIPLVGSVVAFALTLYFDSFIFGRDYLDFPLALRGKRREEKLSLARARRPETIGLGLVVLVSSITPIFGSLALATAATGAVLMHKRWRDAGDPLAQDMKCSDGTFVRGCLVFRDADAPPTRVENP